jgi:hypothetical protein
MFNVLAAIKDGTLEYGKGMESEKLLQVYHPLFKSHVLFGLTLLNEHLIIFFARIG